jgi:CheY-like chemotaxis protein
MEFLGFPALGLALAVVVFVSSQSHSRRFPFYLLWLLSTVSFVVAALTFLMALPEERIAQVISYHNIFAALGFAALVGSSVASQASERSVLFSKLMEERQQRATSEITQLAASNSNLLELLNFSLDKIVSMLGLSGGAIHVFHRARESLVLGSYKGLSARLARRLETIEFGDTSIGRTAKNKRLLIIRDLRLSQDYEFFGGQQDGFTYMALVPIVSEGENWGVITLFGKGAYQPGSFQVDLLEQFGEQLGAALVLGRRVRNIQAARDNLSSLVKALGDELCDTSSMSSGPTASVRGIGWLLARLFGGDRFDICKHSADGWKITYSSEPAMEDRVLNPRHNSDFVSLTSGIILYDQAPPFEEFFEGRSYVYTSIFDGEAWLFIRLEGRRKPAVDLDLLTDSFRIVYGFIARINAIKPIVIPKPPQVLLQSGKESNTVLNQISDELERLISEYSGSQQESDLRDLFTWLEIIQKTAKENISSKALKANPTTPPVTKPPVLSEIIREAISEISDIEGKPLDITFQGNNGILASEIAPTAVKKSVIEFLLAALFESGSKGTLRLSSRADNGDISLELKGEGLAPAPKGAEKPNWLTDIGGRLECSRIENDQGQTIDIWKLSIPFDPQAEANERQKNGIRVLAVDNQDVIRELLTGMLSSLGHESTVVGSSDEALQKFKESLEADRPFTHVIADYGLDKISGLELVKELKTLDPDIFFLLISGWGLTPDPQKAQRAGIDMMLKKPFRMEQLAEIIQSSKRGAVQ